MGVSLERLESLALRELSLILRNDAKNQKLESINLLSSFWCYNIYKTTTMNIF